MKKKFIPGLLLLALTAGGFSTFTSCKDTDEDLYTDLRGEQVSMRADLLKEIADALAEAKKYTDDEIAKAMQVLRSEMPTVPTQSEIEKAAQDVIDAWAKQNGLDDVQGTVKGIIEQMIKDGQLGTGGSTCDCKKFTDEQIQQLVALAAQADALIGEGLDGKGGLIQSVAELKNVLYGADGKAGLVKQVSDLSLWFSEFGDDMDAKKFAEYVEQGAWVKANREVLDNIMNKKDEIALLDKTALEALNKYAADLEGIDNMYKTIFDGVELPEGETAWWNYAQVMQNIKNNSAAISALQDDVDAILGRLNDLVTSLILQTAANHIYGTFNTPFGINSMVLMANFGHLATQLESFPASDAKDRGAECYSDSNIDWSSITSDEYKFTSNILSNLVSNNQTSLGTLWFTVNPGTVNNLNKAGFELVNSKDVKSKVNLIDITKDDDDVRFCELIVLGKSNDSFRTAVNIAGVIDHSSSSFLA